MSGTDEQLYEVTLYWMEEKEMRSDARMQLGGNAVEAVARASMKLRRIRPGVDVVGIVAQHMSDLSLKTALEEFSKRSVLTGSAESQPRTGDVPDRG